MCSLIGAIIDATCSIGDLNSINAVLAHIWKQSHQRGRDGRGYEMHNPWNASFGKSTARYTVGDPDIVPLIPVPWSFRAPLAMRTRMVMIGNLRAEPTTEFVQFKRNEDQQPYVAGQWSIVHNGTIANDKDLRTDVVPTTIDSAAIVELLEGSFPSLPEFVERIGYLKGSFGILALNVDTPDSLFAAANYRPIWYATNEFGTFFASARAFFPDGMVPQMLSPYSTARFTARGLVQAAPLPRPVAAPGRALVVCSGGLDSVVSATYAQRAIGYDIHLIHFLYGSRAEGPEVEAVKAVAADLGCPLTLFPLKVYSKGDSPLLDPDSTVAGGEAGAEFAHEWVPARNLLLLSVATAFAEARGIETIVLGNNLEEAGAYPDNEPEFIDRFNDLLPFAVGDGKRIRVIMPVGNMMKHEIVELGHRFDAPMHLTWSCYRAGALHCGTCGPCYMRRKAFQINNLPEVIQYKDDQ